MLAAAYPGLSLSALTARGRLSAEPVLRLAKKRGLLQVGYFGGEKVALGSARDRRPPSPHIHKVLPSTVNLSPLPKVFCQRPAEGALDKADLGLLLWAQLPVRGGGEVGRGEEGFNLL